MPYFSILAPPTLTATEDLQVLPTTGVEHSHHFFTLQQRFEEAVRGGTGCLRVCGVYIDAIVAAYRRFCVACRSCSPRQPTFAYVVIRCRAARLPFFFTAVVARW